MIKNFKYLVFFSALIGIILSVAGCTKNISETDTVNNDISTKVTVRPGDIVNRVDSLFAPFILDEAVKVSDAIVVGKIVEILPAKEGLDPVLYSKDLPVIYTDVIIQVEKYLAGQIQSEKVGVRLLGGRMGNKIFISDDPEFILGERVLLFLFRDTHYDLTPIPEGIGPSSYFRVVWMFQGKFNLDGDTAINARVNVSLTIDQVEKRISAIKQ